MSKKENGSAMPTDMNPGSKGSPLVPMFMFQGIFTGAMFAATKFGNAEALVGTALAPLGLDAHKTVLLFVILAGFLQGYMAGSTNGARTKYNVPWPHTFAPEANKDKIAFDCVQRAHLNFVENYTQVLVLVYFAAQDTPNLAFVTGTFFLLGRLAFANGYYTGNAKNKDSGVFGYMLGFFPLIGLTYLHAARVFGILP